MALVHFYKVGNFARLRPMWVLAEHNLRVVGLLLGFDGGSTNINCCDGEECCEEVSRE